MKLSYLDNKKVCIWGTGYNGKQVYSYLRTDYNIDCFYDNDESKTGQKFFDLPIKKWDGKRNPEEIIVIASSFWQEIIPQLAEGGMRIFKDYVPWFFLNHNGTRYYGEFWDLAKYAGHLTREDWQQYKQDKKLLLFHGSCHSEQLSILLGTHPEIKKHYKVVCAPRSHLVNPMLPKEWVACGEAYCADKDLFEETDLFIYQEKPDAYEEMDLDDILHKLNKDCQRIRISFLNFAGYFVQCRKNRNYNENRLMYFCQYKDYYVDKLLQKGLTDKEIVENVKREDFIPKERILQMAAVALENVKYLDEKSDVKIYDFIESHYRQEQLFYDPGHPTNKVLVEYANRIIQYILPECQVRLEVVCSEGDIYSVSLPLKSRATVIYPCVIKALGIKTYEKRFLINTLSGFNELLTFEEYIEEYIHWKRNQKE